MEMAKRQISLYICCVYHTYMYPPKQIKKIQMCLTKTDLNFWECFSQDKNDKLLFWVVSESEGSRFLRSCYSSVQLPFFMALEETSRLIRLCMLIGVLLSIL